MSLAERSGNGKVKIAWMEAEKGRWALVGTGFAIHICLGAIYAFSVFRKPLEELWQISTTESGLPFMVFLATWALCMAAAGGLVDRWGPRKTCLLGGALVGIGWFLAGFSKNVLALTFLYGVIGGAGVGTASGATIAVAARWFPDKRGLALGLTLLGFGLSALIMAPIMNALIASQGPLRTFTYSGVVFLAALVLLSVPLRFPPLGWNPRSFTPSQVQARQGVELDRADMVRTGTFRALWVTFMIGCLSGLMAIGIAAPWGKEVAKLSPCLAAMGVSVFAVFNGVGRPLFGWLTDKLTPRFAAVISSALVFVAAAALWLWGEGNVALYFLAFSVLGLNLGGWVAIAPTATATFFGTKYYGKNYGLVFTAFGTGGVLGMVLSGLIRDMTGSYVAVFFPVMVLVVLGGVLAFLRLKPVGTGRT